MEEEKKKKKYSILFAIFLTLAILSGYGFLNMVPITIGDFALSALGIKVVVDGSLLNFLAGTDSNQIQGDSIYFFSLEDLGQRPDGNCYSIAQIGDPDVFLGNSSGEYIVLKNYGSYPSVEFFGMPPYPEVPYEGEYRISSYLPTDDFSDLIDESFEDSHSEIFSNKSDYKFEVLDMDSDILKTPSEIEHDRSNALGGLFLFIIVGFPLFALCAIGLVLGLLLALVTIVLLAMAITFLILFIVFFNKSRNLSNTFQKEG